VDGASPALGPLIADRPISMELKLYTIVELDTHEIFIGEVVYALLDERCLLKDGKPNLAPKDPAFFDFMKTDYGSPAERTGKPWRDGKA